MGRRVSRWEGRPHRADGREPSAASAQRAIPPDASMRCPVAQAPNAVVSREMSPPREGRHGRRHVHRLLHSTRAVARSPAVGVDAGGAHPAPRLTVAERDHLFRLVGRTPSQRAARSDHVGRGMQRVLDIPAMVTNDLGEVLAQNPLAVALVEDESRFERGIAVAVSWRAGGRSCARRRSSVRPRRRSRPRRGSTVGAAGSGPGWPGGRRPRRRGDGGRARR